VNKLLFTKNDDRLVSVGADGIIVWKFLGDVTRDASLLIDHYIEKRMNEKRNEERDLDDDTDLVPLPSLRQVVSHVPNYISSPTHQQEQQQESKVVRFRSDSPPVTHYHGAIHSNFPRERLVALEDEAGLTLDFVCGYNGNARNNIAWNPKTGLFAYTSHNMLIIESLDTRQQKHLLAHEQDITTIAVHDHIIATGSIGNQK
jgi:hypothetical protein